MAASRWILLLLLLILLLIASLSLGSVDIPTTDVIAILFGKQSNEPAWQAIIWDFRMTKAFTCILAGGGLSLAGLQMQTLFRNALAGPDVLGLSSGASLAVAALLLGQSAGLPLLTTNSTSIAVASSIGCFGVFIIMLAIAQRVQDNAALLLVGLMIGAATSSIVSILQYITQAEDLQLYIIWTFGSLGSLSWQEINLLGIVTVIGTVLAIASAKPLNAWLLGENYAQSLGINTRRARLQIILSASILTGVVTAFCGPIAFVGLAVPHLVKLVIKTSNHLILIPAVLLGGASLVLFCDIVTQLPRQNQLLPINAITALVGAPVVIWVIMRSRKISV
ncbi:iron ABC transporter permease [Pseudochryseolinea flava]|uniref:Iron ABC transporter permease n=1 Tax=Pseudochryseolinea flava TaxID=2059302 RepID=A0A364Y0R7_9BACT|nr:iron ABC transporter permease [Pseudochryseolinea flava]RAV99338.1 iron ABC transporter permease [Pseudochryseolinea flava]